MSKCIDQAIAAYQAATSPGFIRAAIQAVEREGHRDLVTENGIHLGAASMLCDVIQAEIARDVGEELKRKEDVLPRAAESALKLGVSCDVSTRPSKPPTKPHKGGA